MNDFETLASVCQYNQVSVSESPRASVTQLLGIMDGHRLYYSLGKWMTTLVPLCPSVGCRSIGPSTL